MASDNILVGLEVGTTKVCVVVGETRDDGPIHILGYGLAPSRGIRKGEIVDFENVHNCVREAIADAEEKSDVTIRSVFVGVTGSHIQSFNNRSCIQLPEHRDEIDESDCEAVALGARDVTIPEPNSFLHTILQHYNVDNQEGIVNPIGMAGRQLEADFHIIHGVRNRIRNTVRCIKEIDMEVEDVVFNGYASAQAVLTPQQKELGALVLDIGGGTTDYIVYVDGSVKQSGVLAIGGDHVTNDLSIGLQFPMGKAERLKMEEGNAMLGEALPGEIITLPEEIGFAGRAIERETLNTIIHYRLRELFELLKAELETEPWLARLGAGIVLTGGGSQMRGINALAREVFGIPVNSAHIRSSSGPVSAGENPQFSTAVGLLYYGRAAYVNREPRGGIFSKFLRLFGKT